jgi:hypothetical protein
MRGQSAAPLLLLLGLHTDGSAATAGTEGHRVGLGSDRYDPAQAIQDRRHRPNQRAPNPPATQFNLSLEGHLRACLPGTAVLKYAAVDQPHVHLGP